MKRIGFFSKLGVLVGILAATPAMANELVVFKAEGVSLVPKQTINDSQPLTLTKGQRVTLIASNGAIINLEGPYNDIPVPKATATKDPGVLETLKMLVTAPKTRSGGLGTTRSTQDAIKHAQQSVKLPEPWVVDVTQSGHYCLVPNKPLVFWRPFDQETSWITVRMGEDAWKAHTQWPAGKDRLTPPTTMPVTDGGTYQVELDGVSTTATLHLLPAGMQERHSQTTWMASKGCMAQVAALNLDKKLP